MRGLVLKGGVGARLGFLPPAAWTEERGERRRSGRRGKVKKRGPAG